MAEVRACRANGDWRCLAARWTKHTPDVRTLKRPVRGLFTAASCFGEACGRASVRRAAGVGLINRRARLLHDGLRHRLDHLWLLIDGRLLDRRGLLIDLRLAIHRRGIRLPIIRPPTTARRGDNAPCEHDGRPLHGKFPWHQHREERGRRERAHSLNSMSERADDTRAPPRPSRAVPRESFSPPAPLPAQAA